MSARSRDIAFVNAVGNSAVAANLAAGRRDAVTALDDAQRARLVTDVDGAIRDLRAVRQALAAPVRTCEVCGERFVGRVDARYHSDACRQRAHRDRGRH